MSTLRVDNIQDNGSGFNDVVSFQNVNGTENGRLCRTFVNFKGTGVVSIRTQLNANSITDHGIGDYTINFSTALTDANYSFVFGGQPEIDVGFVQKLDYNHTASNSSLRIKTGTMAQLVDGITLNVAIFR